MNVALNTLLAMVVFAPIWILRQKSLSIQWPIRYLLAILPAMYTGLGWQFAVFAYTPLGCQGGMKNLHSCWVGGVDITPLVDHGFFLMIPFFFFAGPLSLWLLLNNAAEQIGAWHQKQNSPTRKK
ncbi:hypothetical protein SKTS_11540 [Sulfurimicrobium lacus]|uniref:Uncharacterized protein n=1 Tax=Sulfurimicrobium lacus TaxID=2715678 RepID=A0A6F8V989_9PROT|nr:hypothetical protein [Sulfurimicrobium lacus]BCB26268.1 hypothetical protein SKTS_11540 [Sulfurimicrobium lacus]